MGASVQRRHVCSWRRTVELDTRRDLYQRAEKVKVAHDEDLDDEILNALGDAFPRPFVCGQLLCGQSRPPPPPTPLECSLSAKCFETEEERVSGFTASWQAYVAARVTRERDETQHAAQ